MIAGKRPRRNIDARAGRRLSLSARRHVLAAATIVITATALGSYALSQTSSKGLAPPDSFSHIRDERARSIAYFTELGKVLTHPRCVNCHPAGDRPYQNDDSRPHEPPVWRGADGHGLPAMRCGTCHTDRNFITAGLSVPGHSGWHLAPRSMAWKGKTLAEICAQIKDTKRNGGRSLADLIKHIGTDTLVGWAWSPGYGRSPAPGTQAGAGALVAAWVQTGAACPK